MVANPSIFDCSQRRGLSSVLEGNVPCVWQVDLVVKKGALLLENSSSNAQCWESTVAAEVSLSKSVNLNHFHKTLLLMWPL